MCLKCPSASPPPCPPTISKNSLGGSVADRTGYCWKGGHPSGTPCHVAGEPPRPEDKLKSIVTGLYCHMRPALSDQKKQAMRAGSDGNRLRRYFDLGPSESKMKKL